MIKIDKNNINNYRNELKEQGYGLIHYDNRGIHSYPYDSPWMNDPEFNLIYESIKDNTLVDRIRCYNLYLLSQQANKLSGDILEVGVWRGGTAGIFTQMFRERTVYLADTFSGIVKSSSWEHYSDSTHNDTSKDLVLDFLSNSLGVSNFEVLNGIFPEETGHKIKNKNLALVHLDLDVYLSTKDAFDFIWKSVVKNGIVIFDDYGWISACGGISKFINEIKNDKDKLFLSNMNGQAYIIKV